MLHNEKLRDETLEPSATSTPQAWCEFGAFTPKKITSPEPATATMLYEIDERSSIQQQCSLVHAGLDLQTRNTSTFIFRCTTSVGLVRKD